MQLAHATRINSKCYGTAVSVVVLTRNRNALHPGRKLFGHLMRVFTQLILTAVVLCGCALAPCGLEIS